MRNGQSLISRHRMWLSDASIAAVPHTGVSAAPVAAAMAALDELGGVISGACFSQPDTLTPDRITAYALALMRLRECACAAGLERLMHACDALAVTVSRLIEDRGAACRHHCEALTRFVVHAEDMIRMAAERNGLHVLPVPAFRTASEACAPQ